MTVFAYIVVSELFCLIPRIYAPSTDNNVAIRPKQSYLDVLVLHLKPAECLQLVAYLKSEDPMGQKWNDLSAEESGCLRNLRRVLHGVPLMQAYPLMMKELEQLNRTDVAQIIHKQYLQANADVVQTYLSEMKFREESQAESGTQDEHVLKLAATRNAQEDTLTFGPEIVFISVIFGLFAVLLSAYLILQLILKKFTRQISNHLL